MLEHKMIKTYSDDLTGEELLADSFIECTITKNNQISWMNKKSTWEVTTSIYHFKNMTNMEKFIEKMKDFKVTSTSKENVIL